MDRGSGAKYEVQPVEWQWGRPTIKLQCVAGGVAAAAPLSQGGGRAKTGRRWPPALAPPLRGRHEAAANQPSPLLGASAYWQPCLPGMQSSCASLTPSPWGLLVPADIRLGGSGCCSWRGGGALSCHSFSSMTSLGGRGHAGALQRHVGSPLPLGSAPTTTSPLGPYLKHVAPASATSSSALGAAHALSLTSSGKLIEEQWQHGAPPPLQDQQQQVPEGELVSRPCSLPRLPPWAMPDAQVSPSPKRRKGRNRCSPLGRCLGPSPHPPLCTLLGLPLSKEGNSVTKPVGTPFLQGVGVPFSQVGESRNMKHICEAIDFLCI